VPTSRVLIFEPNSETRAAFQERLQAKHLWVVACADKQEAFKLLESQLFHLCLWRVEEEEDVADLARLKQSRPSAAVLAVSGSASPGRIVACIRSGASNYLDARQGIELFESVVEETLARVVPDSVEAGDLDFPFAQFVGKHPKILEIFQLILSIRGTESTVLITGESGTGKEVVARAIHDLSSRRKHPWIAVNCGAIPGTLLESELFGHVKGAFTGATQNRTGRFQLAGSGTLFLDEISDLPFDLQAKILRAIQNRVYEAVGSAQSLTLEARIIAATNQDLEAAVAEKRFREDLFYRLNVIPVYLPPLRSRKSDIPLLAFHFLQKFARQNQKSVPGISEEAMLSLTEYHWPGNIRELENLMERVVVLKREEGIVELKDIPVKHFKNIRLDRFVANVELPETGLDFNEAVNEFENELILQALQRTSGNKNQAATLLGLNRTTLVEKLKRKGLRITA
jgi:DNA-binding NtrC family response regulator